MKEQYWPLMWQSNLAVIKLRGAYADWARANGLNYHELLVFYSLHELGSCTQKQICDSYRLPKQTVNNIVLALQKAGYLELVPGGPGRSKQMRLTPAGKAYERQRMGALYALEQKAVVDMGPQNLQKMNELLLQFGSILEREMFGVNGPDGADGKENEEPGRENQD